MKALIVYAHPSHNSYNFALKESLKAGLVEAGYEVTESDLYQMHYKPTLNRHDYPSYTVEPWTIDGGQRQAMVDGVYDPDISEEMRKIKDADLIVLQFPFWKLDCPAILTGWYQRNFPMGFGWPEKSLDGKKLWLSLTCGGSEQFYADIVQRSLEDCLYHIVRGFTRMGFNFLPTFAVMGADSITPEERNTHIERLRDTAKNIHNS